MAFERLTELLEKEGLAVIRHSGKRGNFAKGSHCGRLELNTLSEEVLSTIHGQAQHALRIMSIMGTGISAFHSYLEDTTNDVVHYVIAKSDKVPPQQK